MMSFLLRIVGALVLFGVYFLGVKYERDIIIITLTLFSPLWLILLFMPL